jgi:mannose-6-phosphate isomerase
MQPVPKRSAAASGRANVVRVDHETKDETVYLLSGKLVYRVWEDDRPKDVGLDVGQAYRIAPYTIHQMEAVTDCDVLEASTPHLDDVVRLKDRYGREGTKAP